MEVSVSGSKHKVFEVGDPVRLPTLPDAAGKPYDLHHQSRAGHLRVLWMGGTEPIADSARDIQALSQAVERFDAPVTVAAPNLAADIENLLPAAVECVDDPAGTWSEAFGFDAAGGIAVLAPNGRLVGKFPIHAAESVADVCGAENDQTTEHIQNVHAPVLVIRNVLEPELCKTLIAYWRNDSEKFANTVSSSQAITEGNAHVKVRKDVMILDPTLFLSVKNRLLERVFPELIKCMHFRASNMEALRIGCYDGSDGGHFRVHRDNSTPFTANRKFAMSLNLSTDYSGGELRFPEFGRALYRPEPGSAVLFSCSLLHEALPVIMGQRFALFSFFTDAAGEDRDKEMKRKYGVKGFQMRTKKS
jgi:predicted 2-oxoglutarate/Fe(II)-dependent dioxygenase YbiX